MAQTYEEALASAAMVTTENNEHTDPRTLLERRLKRFDDIITNLRGLGHDERIWIIGSAANQIEMVPRNIDAYIDLTGLEEGVRYGLKAALLRIATAGGYHGNYGSFDPFILDHARAYTRSNDAEVWNVHWVQSDISNKMPKAGACGVRLDKFTRRFQEQFGSPEETKLS